MTGADDDDVGSALPSTPTPTPTPTPQPQSPEQSQNESSSSPRNSLTTYQQSSSSSSSLPSGTLEGTLLYRRGRSAKTMLKQSMRMYTTFDMSDRVGLDFGSLKCYRLVGLTKKEARVAYSSTRLARGDQHDHEADADTDSDLARKKQLCLEFPASLPWTVRDVENDTAAFLVEVSTSGYTLGDDWDGYGDDAATLTTFGAESGRSYGRDRSADEFDPDIAIGGEGDDTDEHDDNDEFEDDEDGVFIFWGDDDDEDIAGMPVRDENEGSAKGREMGRPNQVQLDLARAASRNKSFLRYAFRCPSKKNEKALWLKAFGKVGRLSMESNRKKGFFSTASAALSAPNMQRNSRIRTRLPPITREHPLQWKGI